MPFPLRSASALGGLLGLGYSDESESAPYGIKRFSKLWHGIRGLPEQAELDREDILANGLTIGQSAELELPGSSVSKDPWVSERLFSGFDPVETRESEYGPRKDLVLAVDPQIAPNQVRNLSPARYLTGEHPSTAELYGKPNYWHREAEFFAMRNPAPVKRELTLQQMLDDPTVDQYLQLAKDVAELRAKYSYARNNPEILAKQAELQEFVAQHPDLDTSQVIELTNRGDPNAVYREYDLEHPSYNKQELVKPREPNPAEAKLLDDMIAVDERYNSAVADIASVEYKPNQNSAIDKYTKTKLLRNWVGSLGALRNNPGLFEQRFGREIIASEPARYGTPEFEDTKVRYQEKIQKLLKDTLSTYDYTRIDTKIRDLRAMRYELDDYVDKESEAYLDLAHRMDMGGEVAAEAERELTAKYSYYFKKRDQLFDFLNEKIGGMAPPSRTTKLPAAGLAGGGYYAGDYNIGEAKSTNPIQEFFQTNPVGQAATGLMRSPFETGAEMLNETQRMGSEFYGLPEQQTGTKILNYLEQEGAIPRKTGSAWETLGGLLGL